MRTRRGLRGVRPLRWSGVTVALGVALFGRPSAARDFADPAERERKNTAYSLPKGTPAIEVGLLGNGSDLVGRLGAAYGFGGGVEGSINLLHAGVGILNLGSKWTFLEREHVGLAFQLGFLWGHGSWMWIVSGDTGEVVEGLDLISIPIDFIASVPLVDWFQLDVRGGYQHAEVFGGSSGDTLLDIRLGVRQVVFGGSARAYIADRLQLFFTATLPAWTAVPGEVDARVRATEGVYLGVRTADYQKVPFEELYSLELGVNSAMTRRSYITFSMIYRQGDAEYYGYELHPSLKMEFRF
jgi:hypothetical protein